MSPRQFAAAFDKIKHQPIDSDALAQKQFDHPDYEPTEAERAYQQGYDEGGSSERDTAKSEREYQKAYRAPKEKTDDPTISRVKPPAVRAPRPPAQPKPRSPMADIRKMRSLANKARGRRR
jgi:hypothetical protein